MLTMAAPTIENGLDQSERKVSSAASRQCLMISTLSWSGLRSIIGTWRDRF